jgi:hypothetical protein
MTIDDDLLMAYVDGELDDLARARVEKAAAEDPELRARLDQQQRLRETLAAHYAPVAEEPVPERFTAMLQTNVVRLSAPRPRPLWQGLTALAASLVIGLALGRTLLTPAPGVDDGPMLARGELAAALDDQLASAQPADAATRIGITFAATDGRLCRTFDGAALSGLACKGETGWQLMMTAAGAPGSQADYRQAGSGNAAVAAAAQEMMAGEPLDAAAERSARDSGWRGREASR